MVRFVLVKFLLAFTISLIVLQPVYAKLKVTTDRTVLSSNESFTLEIESDQSGNRPELSVLEKDFEIISQNHSQNFTIINGQSSRKNIWTVLLMPKREGEIVIPAIRFGKEESQPINLVIHKSVNPLKDPQAKSSVNQNVFINISIEPKEKVYVQQQISLTIQIFTRIQLAEPSLSKLDIPDVLFEQIGEDKQYTKIINQQSYQVIERQYALFPQKSGTMQIPAIKFEAMSVSRRSSNWPFFSNQGKPIRRLSDPLSVTVLPKPDTFNGINWLPAESVQVSSKKSDLTELKVGESLTITDNIMAQGVLGSLLPSINFPKISGLKLYPDKPQISTNSYNGKIIGQREEKVAIIPTQAGIYNIPIRKLKWWNTNSNKMEEEIIPGFQFKVVGVSPTNTTTVPIIQAPVQTPIPVRPKSKPSKPITMINQGYSSLIENPWFWSTILLVIVYFISLILYWLKRSANKAPNSSEASPQNNEKQLLNELAQHCKNNLKKPAMQTLLKWANNHFNKDQETSFNSLTEIIKKISSPELIKEIKDLDAAIYAAAPDADWKGQDLWHAVKSFLKDQADIERPDAYKLPPLNP